MPSLMMPVARMIGGDLYKLYPRTDQQGNPLLKKDGTPSESMSIGIAIKKGPETHWNETPWGKQIYDAAVAAWPNGEHSQPAFSWKITDGDSQVPDKKMNKPCDKPGYAGNWVIWFSQGWLTSICNADGTQILTEPNAVMPGYWVQVAAEFKSNGATYPKTPGMYMSPKAVALTAYDTIITTSGSVDTTSLGFGGQALPEGASLTPIAQIPQAGAPAVPQTAPPAPDFASGPPAPPAPTGPVTTPAAGGATWEQLQAAGWTEDVARQNGMIV